MTELVFLVGWLLVALASLAVLAEVIWLKWLRAWREARAERRRRDAALALAVVMAWQEGGPLPSTRLQRWCNRRLTTPFFPERSQMEGT